MPALAQALSGVLPQSSLRSLMQALGNCMQDVQQRGGVNVQPSYRLPNGLGNPATWQPSEYPGLLPYAGQTPHIVLPGIPGDAAADWFSTFIGGNTFNFPTNQQFTANNYWGGPTNTIYGDTYFQQISTTVVNTPYTGEDTKPPGAPQAPTAPTMPPTSPGGGSQPFLIPPAPFTPPIVQPIQYVTDVKVSLQVMRTAVKLPKVTEGLLTESDLESTEIGQNYALNGTIEATANLPLTATYDGASNATATVTIPSQSFLTLSAASVSPVLKSSTAYMESATAYLPATTANISLGTVNISVPTYKFNTETCSNDEVLSNVTVSLGTASVTIPQTAVTVSPTTSLVDCSQNIVLPTNTTTFGGDYNATLPGITLNTSEQSLNISLSNVTVEAGDNVSVISGVTADPANSETEEVLIVRDVDPIVQVDTKFAMTLPFGQ